MMRRRDFLRLSALAALIPVAGAAGDVAPPSMTVYRSPSCGCCKKWVAHARAAGFRVTEKEMDDLAEVKAMLGVPAALHSCHTAVTGAYVVEGHVPADLVQRMVKERPSIRGLAVPGMPVGSPGMEGGRPERYDVLAFDRAGATRVYARR